MLKNRTESVAFCGLVAKSGHSGVMAGTQLLESRKVGSTSEPVKPLSLGGESFLSYVSLRRR